MPPSMIEIYRLILEKRFMPRFEIKKDNLWLYLQHPSKPYYTKFKHIKNKWLWSGGVATFRIFT